jgi:hypothetical protein
LERLIADARARIGIPDLRWLQVRSPYWGASINLAKVRNAQVAVAEADPNAAWVSSDNPLGVPNVFFTDGIHPDLASTERIGYTWAKAWVDAFPTFESTLRYAGVSGADASTTYDPDGDGPAILEYALGGDIARYDPETWKPVIRYDSTSDTYTTALNIRDNDPSLHTELQYSTDLNNWFPLTGVDAIDQTGVSQGYVRRQFSHFRSDEEQIFYRVQSTYN